MIGPNSVTPILFVAIVVPAQASSSPIPHERKPHFDQSQYLQASTILTSSFMASQDIGRPLPKFGEWDVNNPASAEGYTVIFKRARDEKKTGYAKTVTPRKSDTKHRNESYPRYPRKSKWFCCL